MKVYPASAIHNVAVVGHNGVGKTTLVSALLHEAGATPRFGRVEEGNTPTDFDPEEIERKISISLAVASLEWKKKKVNLIDTPGYGIFVSEMICGLKAADAALLVVDAVAGVQVQTEKAWKLCDELGLPRLVVVNRMDRENAATRNECIEPANPCRFQSAPTAKCFWLNGTPASLGEASLTQRVSGQLRFRRYPPKDRVEKERA